MADVTHSSLTGGDLHESKGAADASLGQVAVANGSGQAVFASLNYTYLSNKPVIPTVSNAGAVVSTPTIQTYTTTTNSAGAWNITIPSTSINFVSASVVSGGTALGTAASANIASASTVAVSGSVIVHSASANALAGAGLTVRVMVVGS